jgi:hypothetical protein
MSDTEAMATAIVAALHFHGNGERVRGWLGSGGYLLWRCSAKAASTIACMRLVSCFSYHFSIDFGLN